MDKGRIGNGALADKVSCSAEFAELAGVVEIFTSVRFFFEQLCVDAAQKG